MVKAGLLGNGTYQSRRVKTRPRPKNMARRQTAQFGNEIGHHITGIGDVDEDSLEAPLHDLGNEVSNLSHRKVHFRIPVMGNQQINFPNGIDDDIAVAQFFIGSHGILDMMGHEHGRIHEILMLTDKLLFIDITKFDKVSRSRDP